MNLFSCIGLLIIILCGSCSQPKLHPELGHSSDIIEQRWNQAGLQVTSGANQGSAHTISNGDSRNYRHFTTTITNMSDKPIHIQLILSQQYDLPERYGDRSYSIFLLPPELTPDTIAINNNITTGLVDFFDHIPERAQAIDQTLQPNDYVVFTIGALYDNPTTCGIVPTTLFLLDDNEVFSNCESLISDIAESSNTLTIGVKLNLCEDNCRVVSCGKLLL